MVAGTVLSWQGLERTLGIKMPQRGMYFRLHPQYSAVFCSLGDKGAYADRELADGTIEYIGHNAPVDEATDPASADQPLLTRGGKLTPNAHFRQAATEAHTGIREAEPVRVFEKLVVGIWRDRGFYRLVDCREQMEGGRRIFIFTLVPEVNIPLFDPIPAEGRSIPARIRAQVWERDGGRCVECGSTSDLTFDHVIPLALGGAGNIAGNIQILCARCNAQKGVHIGWSQVNS